MQNPRLAHRYAKSIIDLSTETGQLNAVYADMKLISRICRSNADFMQVLKSPIIKSDKKGKIIQAVLQTQVSELTSKFVLLLVNKTRENSLSEIADAFIAQYNDIHQIRQVKITTAAPMSDAVEQAILAKVKAAIPAASIELETAIDEELIGGFMLETADKLIDMSILRDLKDVRKQFLNNDYIHRIR
jgi:F-type H+-transporting ATPase subunit delta